MSQNKCIRCGVPTGSDDIQTCDRCSLSQPHASAQGAAPFGSEGEGAPRWMVKMATGIADLRASRGHGRALKVEIIEAMQAAAIEALRAAPHAPAPVQAAPTEPTLNLPKPRSQIFHGDGRPPTDLWSEDQIRAALGTPAPVASHIPANVRDNAACDSSVSHKAAPVAADTLTDWERIAGMLDAYVESIKEHGGEALERWHYIPEVEDAAETIRAFASPARAAQGAAPVPPEPMREPLSEDAVWAWWASENGLEDHDMCKLADFREVIRAVEGKLGIAGTAQSGEGE